MLLLTNYTSPLSLSVGCGLRTRENGSGKPSKRANNGVSNSPNTKYVIEITEKKW